MKQFKLLNNIFGWGVFAIAAISYLMTMEPTTSMWDCSEFIATSYKLEVGHPPGAPLYMMLARLASFLAPTPEDVPMMINGMNCIASAFCIMFLFWHDVPTSLYWLYTMTKCGVVLLWFSV